MIETSLNFQKLIDDVPAEALKYLQEFIKNPFWAFYVDHMKKELDQCDESLRTGPLDSVVSIRGSIKAINLMLNYTEQTIDYIKDQIALQKEAADIEAARTQDKGQMPGQTP